MWTYLPLVIVYRLKNVSDHSDTVVQDEHEICISGLYSGDIKNGDSNVYRHLVTFPLLEMQERI